MENKNRSLPPLKEPSFKQKGRTESSSFFCNQNRSVVTFQLLKEILHRLRHFFDQTKDGESAGEYRWLQQRNHAPTKANPKSIFISESLSPSEKEDLIQLIREYIYVFACNYEDMPRLDPQVAMHRLNINLDAKLVKQQQWWFHLEIMEAIESEVKSL